MRGYLVCLALGFAIVVTASPRDTAPASTVATLKSPADFAGIADRDARSIALFTEAAKVLQDPRCLNCHPVTRSPTQGDDLHAHVPPIDATAGDHGPPGLACNTCHQSANVITHTGSSIASIPGHPLWGLAPVAFAWQGKSIGDICTQVKDPKRNGNRSLEKIHEHMAKDDLVGWAWHPGPGRKPAPGTQERFGELIAAWIDTGAACPK
ncbi:MAG TPA: hypothetical protein VGO76_10360 [Luteibacter sp.]|jgi:hypothetical protein|nr:hypothetical protein [Luteibacter sp.]